MTENQEKELLSTLANLVTGVTEIRSDITDIRSDVREIKVTQDVLVSKVDSIAVTVMATDRRLAVVENRIDDLEADAH
ncbi:MAG TPA: hypothetical protein VMS29_01930 [Pyrinomonadaceae bacterium]|jgi:hypothetical protein|nr:hypothetical protein [Pyrinomonadaceae bacterium]